MCVCVCVCVCVSALLLVFSHCKDVCPSLQKWCVPVHIQLCASTLLVVCSVHVVGGGGGGGHFVIQKVRPMLC